MNKAAEKEPSMDEILSSIRQIIADDEESVDSDVKEDKETGTANNEVAGEDNVNMKPSEDKPEEIEDTDKALELTPEQIVKDETENIDFSPADQNESLLEDNIDEEDNPEEMELVVPDDVEFDEKSNQEEAAGEEQVKPTSPTLPDPDLSTDMAEGLLEPATEAVVKKAFKQLGNIGFDNKDLTIEAMIREMLRPMLKEWLDENLPSIVEKAVRQEVERLSRGL